MNLIKKNLPYAKHLETFIRTDWAGLFRFLTVSVKLGLKQIKSCFKYIRLIFIMHCMYFILIRHRYVDRGWKPKICTFTKPQYFPSYKSWCHPYWSFGVIYSTDHSWPCKWIWVFGDHGFIFGTFNYYYHFSNTQYCNVQLFIYLFVVLCNCFYWIFYM